MKSQEDLWLTPQVVSFRRYGEHLRHLGVWNQMFGSGQPETGKLFRVFRGSLWPRDLTVLLPVVLHLKRHFCSSEGNLLSQCDQHRETFLLFVWERCRWWVFCLFFLMLQVPWWTENIPLPQFLNFLKYYFLPGS